MSTTRAGRPSTSSQSPLAKARSLCSAMAAIRFLSTSCNARPSTAEITVEETTSAVSLVTPKSASPAMNAPRTIPSRRRRAPAWAPGAARRGSRAAQEEAHQEVVADQRAEGERGDPEPLPEPGPVEEEPGLEQEDEAAGHEHPEVERGAQPAHAQPAPEQQHRDLEGEDRPESEGERRQPGGVMDERREV